MGRVTPIKPPRITALEFFAGIGLARIGLESAGIGVVWANDFEPKKKAMYDVQHPPQGDHEFVLGDIAAVRGADLPSGAGLAWASSPCTDLSLAGGRAGLDGHQSGTFWEFVRILNELPKAPPRVVVLENVVGLATSHGGDDLTAAIRALNSLGYSIDILSIDARRFVPQSRPRLFLVGALEPPQDQDEVVSDLRPDWLQWVFQDRSLATHRARLPAPPPLLTSGLGQYVEDVPRDDDRWWDQERTDAFIRSLSSIQLQRLSLMRESNELCFRTAYRRTRAGAPVWEVRADDIAGCLRTARGGSSKQAVVLVGRNTLRVRWMTPLEYARLMGAGNYQIGSVAPGQALFGFGDAVAVPAVKWLADNYLVPLAEGQMRPSSVIDLRDLGA